MIRSTDQMTEWMLSPRNFARGATGLLALLLMAQAAVAQQQEVTAPLDIPNDVHLLAPADPSIRKATAIVNGTIITDTDIDQRLALVLAANGNQNLDPAERERLRAQVLSNLIDETLQIQEAVANKIVIEASEIDQTYVRIATQFKQTPDQFGAFIRQQGSSPASMRRQIEGELAWRRVLGREVEPFISVSDEEVNQVIARMNAAKGSSEYHVGEIYLSATPMTQDAVVANVQRIVQQVRQGASFVAYARQYSEASTAAVGGDLGWVRAEQLPDALAQVVTQMPPGAISDPIPVGGGFSLVTLIDKRQVLTADPRDTILSLKQVTIVFPPGTTAAAGQPRVTAFTNALQSLKGCGSVEDVAKSIGADVVNNDQVKVRDLPPQLQPLVLNLRVGEATPPFGSSDQGVRALVVCGRDDPEAAGVPSFEEVQSQMEEQRVNLRARRYLRDLRRDAVIDYR